LQVSVDSAFSTTVYDSAGITATTMSLAGLACNTRYYWHVNANNAGGTSVWSEVWSFTTVPPAPNTPTLALPSNSSTDQPLSLTLTWNAVSGASTYRVHLSTSSVFSGTIIDDSTLTSASIAVGPFSTSTTYYWRVNAKNVGGTSVWSEVWSFSTVPPVPDTPSLISPINGATGQPTSL
jgi:hypothetical protein